VSTDPTATIGTSPTIGTPPSYTQFQQLYWTNATPMETGIAPAQDAIMAFANPNNLESSVFTGTTGYYQEGQSLPQIQGSRQASALNTGVMAVAEARYGRMDESLRYVDFIADELDVEQPGALPELFNSPDYPYYPSFAGAMVMQAWDSYGIHWPLIEFYLGIQPDVPSDSIVVVPDLPSGWPQLSIDNLQVGKSVISVSTQHSGNVYLTSVDAPPGWQLIVGYALPANSQVKLVTLNGSPAAFQIVDTNRGREVHVLTNSGKVQNVSIQTD
jgi:hypothetical protein